MRARSKYYCFSFLIVLICGVFSTVEASTNLNKRFICPQAVQCWALYDGNLPPGEYARLDLVGTKTPPYTSMDLSYIYTKTGKTKTFKLEPLYFAGGKLSRIVASKAKNIVLIFNPIKKTMLLTMINYSKKGDVSFYTWTFRTKLITDEKPSKYRDYLIY